jgi:hypothetical protein
MYSLRVLQLSVQASIDQNLTLHSSYREHCNVVTKLLEVLTYTPHGCYGLPGQLVHICSVPEHKLPCSRAAAYAWRTEVSRGGLSPSGVGWAGWQPCHRGGSAYAWLLHSIGQNCGAGNL